MKKKLDIYDFGKQLLDTLDLDPVYVAIYYADLPSQRLSKWLVAYWCFYHCGTASWITDQPNFFVAMEQAAASKDWSRGSERRHFRGEQARKAVADMQRHYRNPDTIIQMICGELNEQYTLHQVAEKTKTLRGFGDWIAFKVADMIERLGLCDVRFRPSDVFQMFESPRLGAELMYSTYGGSGSPYEWAISSLSSRLSKHKAPPRFERTINIQELETILCKWKSHMNGHYEVGKDILEVREGLHKYPNSKTAKEILLGMKRGNL